MFCNNSIYVPGWDCHGLPIEWKIEEKYREKGKSKEEVLQISFVKTVETLQVIDRFKRRI